MSLTGFNVRDSNNLGEVELVCTECNHVQLRFESESLTEIVELAEDHARQTGHGR